MSYATFAHPKNGYHQNSAQKLSYLKPARPQALKVADDDKKEGTFTDLPATGGVGEYHINHFLGFSQPVSAPTPQFVRTLNKMFYSSFVELFSNENIAEARLQPYNGRDFVKFTIGGKSGSWFDKFGGFVHSDWIRLEMHSDGNNFLATTLHRDWLWDSEKVAITLKPEAERYIDVNRHHFLAGRRVFAIRFDVPSSRYVIETAAFERSSLCEYKVADDVLFRNRITILWTTMIESFEKVADGWASGKPEVVPEGYTVKGNVVFIESRHKLVSDALLAPWFGGILSRYPGLTKGLAFG